MTCEQPIHHHLQCHLSPTLHYTLTFTRLHLKVSRSQYDYCSRLFQILDVDGTGLLSKEILDSFVQKYCPCWTKRDSQLLSSVTGEHSPLTTTTTLDEVWDRLNEVRALSSFTVNNNKNDTLGCTLSGFLLLCRFAILIQYEAQYSSTSSFCEDQNLQESSDAVVMVQVQQQQHQHNPITMEDLQTHDESFQNCIPPFELLIQPDKRQHHHHHQQQQQLIQSSVKVERFVGNDEYVIRYSTKDFNDNLVVVRRLMKDWKWLFRFYQQHGRTGGILCGRIVPSFSHKDSSAGNVVQQISKTILGQDTSSTQDPGITTRKLERYINYMLEHPVFASSFALYTMLHSTQKGFDAAKFILKDIQHPTSSDGTVSSMKDHSSKDTTNKSSLIGSSSKYLYWVRSAAAQAAMAMKIHGILETTGYQSASAKLQHASLPNFARNDNDYNDDTMMADDDDDDDEDTYLDEDSFEDGVVSISSELDTRNNSNIVSFSNPGFELLPSPRPLSERSALCAGCFVFKTSSSFSTNKDDENNTTGKSRANYYDKYVSTSSVTSSQKKNLFLGELSVENDIQRLYFLLSQVQSNMKRFKKILSTLSSVSQQQKDVIVSIWKGRWLGREMMLPNQLLLRGVEKLDHALGTSIGSYRQFVEDASWHSALAKAAVRASKNVHSTILASYTAKRAKTAAESALLVELENESNNGGDDKKISIARSQAIRAAVLEHESMIAKKRATVALSCDVKVWNVHRKREIQKSCLDFVQAQVEASRSAVSAWEDLRNGLLSSSLSQKDPIEIVGSLGSTPKTSLDNKARSQQNSVVEDFSNLVLSLEDLQEDDITEISNPMGLDDVNELNHDQSPGKPIISSIQTNESNNDDFTNNVHNENKDFIEKYNDDDDDDLFSLEDPVDTLASESMFINNNTSHTIRNDIIKEENEHIENDKNDESQQLVRSPIIIRDYNNILPSSSLLSDDINNNETISSHQKSPSSMPVNPNKADTHVKSEIMDRGITASSNTKERSSPNRIIAPKIMDDDVPQKPNDNNHNATLDFPMAKSEDHDSMTDSMQSLVDGLMTWGGGTPYPSSDDIFHLAGKTDSDDSKMGL